MEHAIINGKKFGTGADIPDPQDSRDFEFTAPSEFDWELGFDIEKLLGFRMTCKDEKEFFGKYGREGWGVERYKEILDIIKRKRIKPFKLLDEYQGSAPACTGMANAYYLAVLNAIETGKYDRISARDCYAYIALGLGRGAYLRDACKLDKNRGIATEELVRNYHRLEMSYGTVYNPYNKTEFFEKPEVTPEIERTRKMLQLKDYYTITGYISMDKMAWEILMGFGSYFAVNGSNNGTWHDEYPQPPEKKEWGHALYAGKAGLDKKGQKYIGLKNSWGNSVGINGWQKLTKNYFDTYNVRSPYTFIDKNNNWIKLQTMFYKEKGKSSVYVYSKDKDQYVPIIDGNVIKEAYGGFNNINIIEVEKIPQEKITKFRLSLVLID